MDSVERRKLRAEYKDRKPEMGVVSIRCIETGEEFLTAATDVPAMLNRLRFQLDSDMCPNAHLQSLWSQLGEAAFELGVVQRLECDDADADCADDLETLCELCLAERPEAQRLWK